jgi:predicted transcriptional regulator
MKKSKKEVVVYYGHEQHAYMIPTSSRRRFFEVRNTSRYNNSRFQVIETVKKLKLRNTYRITPYFRPGDTVYVVVADGFGTTIIKDTIEEVFSFGVKKCLKNYWLKLSGSSTGIDADNVYTSYNQAKFFLHY